MTDVKGSKLLQERNDRSAYLLMRTIIWCFVLGSASAVSASETAVKVSTRMAYSEDPNNQGVRRKLLHEFKKDALRTLTADPNYPQAKARLMDTYFDDMASFDVIDKFFYDIKFAGNMCDTRTAEGCGEVRDNALILKGIAYINANAIDNFLVSVSDVTHSPELNDFAVLFIARKVLQRKVFDEKTTSVQSSETSSSTEVFSGADGTSKIEGGASESFAVSQSGGSRVTKADDFAYEIDLGLTDSFQSAVQQHLIDSGFEPFLMEDVLYAYDMDGLEEMIANGAFTDDGTVSRRSMAQIRRTAVKDEITFLAIGKVDYRLGDFNELTGTMRVPATVSVEVFRSSGRRMRAIASVQPTMVYGSYPKEGDYTVGQIDAQNKAVSKAMDTIIAQLQVAAAN